MCNSNIVAVTGKIKMRYERFLDMVKTCDTATDSSFKDFRKGLSKDLRAADRVSFLLFFFVSVLKLFVMHDDCLSVKNDFIIYLFCY